MSAKPQTPSFTAEMLKGVGYTLSTQCSTPVEVEKPFSWGETQNEPVQICATISVSSEAYCGVVMLAFPKTTFLGAIGRMFGSPFTEVSDEIADGAGELLNMIFGTAKTQLTNHGHKMNTALPTTICGDNLRLRPSQVGKAVAYPIRADLGIFYLIFHEVPAAQRLAQAA